MAVADTNEERGRAIAGQYGAEWYADYRQLLSREDIEVVSIVLPDHLHKEACVTAAGAGKHIMVEKPLATTMEDARAIAAAVAGSGVRLMVDFANRWSPPYLHAQRAIAAGEIGIPLHISMKLNDTLMVPTSMLKWSNRSSVAWFLASHCVDLLRFLLADEVVRLRALARSVVLRGLGIDTPDFFHTVLEFARGTVVTLENSWVLPTAGPTVFEFATDIVGSAGRLQIDTAQHGCIRQTTDRVAHPDIMMFNELDGRVAGFGFAPIEHFLQSLRTGQPFSVSMDDALQDVKIVAAIERSARDGAIVEL